MGRTPDRAPGVSDEEGIILSDEGVAATQAGEVRYNGGAFSMFDSSGAFDPRTGGGGLSEAAHAALDTLLHNLSENHYVEMTRSGGRVTDVIVWTSSGKTLKVRELNITRSANKVSTIVLKQYNGAGAVVETLTGTVARSSGRVASIDWVKT